LRGRLAVGAVLLFGAAYFAVFGGDYDVFDLRRVRHERALEEARVEALRAEVEQLGMVRDSLAGNSAVLERLARERYGLIRDGERLYRFVDSPQESAVPRSAEPPTTHR
jgi:cell division protein FtsB